VDAVEPTLRLDVLDSEIVGDDDGDNDCVAETL
jgi:hypothetical protein